MIFNKFGAGIGQAEYKLRFRVVKGITDKDKTN